MTIAKAKPLKTWADTPKQDDPDVLHIGFWRAWGQRRARAMRAANQRIRQLEHEVRLLRQRLRKRSEKIQRLSQQPPAGSGALRTP